MYIYVRGRTVTVFVLDRALSIVFNIYVNNALSLTSYSVKNQQTIVVILEQDFNLTFCNFIFFICMISTLFGKYHLY